MAKVNQPHARQDYCTPPELLDAVRRKFSVELAFDAACTRENAVAELGFFYPEHDALAESWTQLEGLDVWCNPPFAQSGAFAAKAAATNHMARLQPRIFLLVQAAVDTLWWEESVRYHARVFHLAPRPAFVGCAQGINRALALCEYGPSVTPGEERWVWKQPKNKKENK
jgi:phage N-6-adenine-methyltransferase